MLKDTYQFSCPCCGKRIELDSRTGKARAVSTEAKKDLEDLLGAEKRQQDKLSDQFDRAQRRQRDQAQELDDLLDRAKKDAKENPDEDVRRPFDLD